MGNVRGNVVDGQFKFSLCEQICIMFKSKCLRRQFLLMRNFNGTFLDSRQLCLWCAAIIVFYRRKQKVVEEFNAYNRSV